MAMWDMIYTKNVTSKHEEKKWGITYNPQQEAKPP